jgi:branched-chain amino acid transport system substrate-binding protein
VGANSSSLSMSIGEVAEAKGIVQVSNISTAEDLTWDPVKGRERRYVFRVCGSDTVMGALLAKFAAGHLHARRVAVLYEVGSAYSSRLAQSFAKSFTASARGRVAAEFVYLPREIDYREQLRSIKAFAPDVLFLPAFSADATLVARQAADVGLTATLLGGDGWSSKVLFGRAQPVGPAYYADLCSPPEAFREKYLRAYGEEPEGCRAVLAYDAVLAVARALDALGPLKDAELTGDLAATRERLRAALVRVDFVGRTGRIRFDAHRNREGGMAIMELACGPEQCVPRLFRMDHAS